METGTITGREIAKNLDAEKKTLLLQVVVADENDGQTVELQNSAGTGSNPADGARVFIEDVSDSYRVGVAVDDGIEPSAELEPGEEERYSSDGGVKKARTVWKKDGQLVLNDGTETAVKYSKLQAAFDKLKDDHNALVDIVNTLIGDVDKFAKLYIPGGPTVVGTPPAFLITAKSGSASDADITPAESGTVNLP